MNESTAPDITVCVFAWNEVATLRSFVEELNDAADRLVAQVEILVIDDGSTDGTSAVADLLERESTRVRVLHHSQNEGLGGVYRTGFAEARGQCITFFPGDAQFPASIVGKLHATIAGHDMVLGYLPTRHDAVGRVLSAAERLLYRALLGRMPRFQGVFMVRRSVLDGVKLVSAGRGWAIVMELILRAHRQGYRMVSTPTDYRPRSAGHSKVNNLRNISANLRQLLALKRMIAAENA